MDARNTVYNFQGVHTLASIPRRSLTLTHRPALGSVCATYKRHVRPIHQRDGANQTRRLGGSSDMDRDDQRTSIRRSRPTAPLHFDRHPSDVLLLRTGVQTQDRSRCRRTGPESPDEALYVSTSRIALVRLRSRRRSRRMDIPTSALAESLRSSIEPDRDGTRVRCRGLTLAVTPTYGRC